MPVVLPSLWNVQGGNTDLYNIIGASEMRSDLGRLCMTGFDLYYLMAIVRSLLPNILIRDRPWYEC